MLNIKFALDLIRTADLSEATALSNEPQPLPLLPINLQSESFESPKIINSGHQDRQQNNLRLRQDFEKKFGPWTNLDDN